MQDTPATNEATLREPRSYLDAVLGPQQSLEDVPRQMAMPSTHTLQVAFTSPANNFGLEVVAHAEYAAAKTVPPG